MTIKRLLETYPRKRKKLESDYNKIYKKFYYDNLNKKNFVSSLIKKMETKLFKQFAITNNFLDGLKSSEQDKSKVKELGFTLFFELYDDDDVKYYSGYMRPDIEDEFIPLDWGMYDSGCTYIKIRNSNGKMEIL